MSDVVRLLIQQVTVMFLLMLVGYITYRAGMVKAEGVAQLSNIALYVATPATVLNSFLTAFDADVLKNAVWAFVLACVMFGVSFLLTQTVFRKISNLAKFGVIYCNVGFLGIPLVQMVLGQTAVFYMTMVVAMMTITTFTHGIFLVSGDRSLVSIRKILTNPAIISVGIGLILYCLQISLPSTLTKTISMLSGLNAPLAMMVLGCYLAEASMKTVLADKETYWILLGRLILTPAIMCVILRLLPSSLHDVKQVIIIASSTPVAAALGMFAQKYGRDYAYGAGVISLSTVLSLITMPLFLYLLG